MPPVPKPVRVKDRTAIERARKPWCEWCWDLRKSCHVHHIKSRGAGGHDMDDNLICLCWECHDKAHRGLISRDELRRRKEEILAGVWAWKVFQLTRMAAW